jgi:hypothetical protein
MRGEGLLNSVDDVQLHLTLGKLGFQPGNPILGQRGSIRHRLAFPPSRIGLNDSTATL